MKVTFAVCQATQKEVFTTIFTSEEWTAISKYSEYVHELRQGKVYKKSINVKIKLNAAIGQPVNIETELPDWEDIIVILHRIRPFILRNESTSFEKIRNILYKRIENNQIRGILAYNHELYQGKYSRSMIKVAFTANASHEEIVINSERFLQTWLNAYEYHRDADKQAFLKVIRQHFPSNLTQAFLVSQIVDKLKSIGNICGIIDTLTGKIKDFVFGL